MGMPFNIHFSSIKLSLRTLLQVHLFSFYFFFSIDCILFYIIFFLNLYHFFAQPYILTYSLFYHSMNVGVSSPFLFFLIFFFFFKYLYFLFCIYKKYKYSIFLLIYSICNAFSVFALHVFYKLFVLIPLQKEGIYLNNGIYIFKKLNKTELLDYLNTLYSSSFSSIFSTEITSMVKKNFGLMIMNSNTIQDIHIALTNYMNFFATFLKTRGFPDKYMIENIYVLATKYAQCTDIVVPLNTTFVLSVFSLWCVYVLLLNVTFFFLHLLYHNVITFFYMLLATYYGCQEHKNFYIFYLMVFNSFNNVTIGSSIIKKEPSVGNNTINT
jgi:hypothetical protein